MPKGKWVGMSTKQMAVLFEGVNQVAHAPSEPQEGDSSGGNGAEAPCEPSTPHYRGHGSLVPTKLQQMIDPSDSVRYRPKVIAPWPEHVDLREHELTPV
jgi:hypothetical protein